MSSDIALIQLNSHVSILPGLDALAGHASDPSFILLFGWMEARAAHLFKYADGFKARYPSSKIVVVRATNAWYLSSQAEKERLIEPVADIIHEEIQDPVACRGIMVHVISNGGGFQLFTLRRVLSRKVPCSVSDIVPTTVTLDSTPGDSGLYSSIASFTMGLNPVFRILAILPISILYGVFHIINASRGNAPVFTELRDVLLRPDILPGITSSNTPRLYIYSERDDQSYYKYIEAHIEEAVKQGYDVSIENFKESAHVSHMRKNPERYWGAVQCCWLKVKGVSDIATSHL